MYLSWLFSVAARPEFGIVVFVVMSLPVVALVTVIALAAVVALFAGRARADRARLVLGDVLAALLVWGGRR